MPMLVALVALVLGIFALVDCLRSTGSHARGLPVAVWVGVIVLLPVMGPVAWLLAGRASGASASPGPRPSSASGAPKGPDDDDDFLRSLDRKDRGDL